MFESLDGLLTPCTRQNSGRSVSVMFVGVTSVPVVTMAAAVTVVLPGNASCVSSAQSSRLGSFSRANASSESADNATAAAAATRAAPCGTIGFIAIGFIGVLPDFFWIRATVRAAARSRNDDKNRQHKLISPVCEKGTFGPYSRYGDRYANVGLRSRSGRTL